MTFIDIGNKFRPERLTYLRELKNETLIEVGKVVDNSPQLVSLWEHGKSTPSFQHMEKLAEHFGTTRAFFVNNTPLPQNSGNTFYRKLVAVPKKKWTQAERTAKLYAYFEEQISGMLNLQYFKLPDYANRSQNFQMLDYDYIDEVAKAVRKEFSLGNGPISNMTLLVEKMGIRVQFMNFFSEKIDALTDQLDNHFYIILNSERTSSVRIRFNLAHELGHALLHSFYLLSDTNTPAKRKIIEAEANHFAGALLMPADGLAIDMGYTNMAYLKELKKHWLVAISALIYRGNELGLIADQQALFLRQTIARNGWNKEEPYDDTIPIEKPTFLNSAIEFMNYDKGQLLNAVAGKTGWKENTIISILNNINFSSAIEKASEPKLRLIKNDF